MIVGYILGFVFLPVSLLLFSNILKFTNIDKIIGIPVLMIAAGGIILVEIGDIIDSHIQGHAMIVYATGLLLAIPGILYFISLAAKLPDTLTAALPLMMASFLFVEGVSSFHIGES